MWGEGERPLQASLHAVPAFIGVPQGKAQDKIKAGKNRASGFLGLQLQEFRHIQIRFREVFQDVALGFRGSMIAIGSGIPGILGI